ncbi:transposase [candidate division WOR-3 bacterium]|nr:transposase [candidate division WOR-3 bacterium]MCK4526871.1 transposase [candidate division WOR-3 bacterium]
MPKRYSPRLKFQVVMEVISDKRDPSQIARSYDVHPNTIRNWVERFRENGSEIFSKDGEVKDLEREIAELERLLGQKEREIAILKNFLGRV